MPGAQTIKLFFHLACGLSSACSDAPRISRRLTAYLMEVRHCSKLQEFPRRGNMCAIVKRFGNTCAIANERVGTNEFKKHVYGHRLIRSNTEARHDLKHQVFLQPDHVSELPPCIFRFARKVFVHASRRRCTCFLYECTTKMQY